MSVWAEKREKRKQENEFSHTHSQIHTNAPNCPECGSTRVWKAGLRYVTDQPIQRYLCRVCGYRFSETSKNKVNQNGRRQICVLMQKAKNLTRAKQKNEALRKNEKGDLVNFAWHLKKLGRNPSTIKTYQKHLKTLSIYGDLYDPESVKTVIASKACSNNTKRLICDAYNSFTKFKQIQWTKPNYKIEHKRIFIPTEEELQLAINTGNQESRIYIMFLYETGARDNEASRLEWTDIDRERKRVTVKSSKNGNARIVPISQKLIDLLLSLPKNQDTVFPRRTQGSRSMAFHARMIRLTRVQKEPRFLKIHLHTFRHCKAIREYHKTKSILHVKKILGHKDIKTTMRYLDLYNEIYDDLKPTNYVCETAITPKEAKQLIESGFEYVCEIDGFQMFRKVKL